MARATTPTRRPACAAAAASTFSAPAPFLARRVTLSDADAGFRPQPPPTRNGLPSFRLTPAAVVSHGGGHARRSCSCSPTTHPGSFRCAMHRGHTANQAAAPSGLHGDARRSAMANSLVRIAAVEGGDHVRRALAALVRPSSHHQRRRAAFRLLPSRLSAMSTAADKS